MANRLALETSPYLLQHKDNPVDWQPWGAEAFAEAARRDVPLLVSIGYSACHWCHVMERESFEDPDLAALMNERFVPVKVDREERPDVDAIQMEAVQAMTGQGGWPLNVFLTPEQVPFYGGTYFPPEPRHGLPSFAQVLIGVSEAWSSRAAEIRAGAEQVIARLGATAMIEPDEEPLRPDLLREAVEALRAGYDTTHGGFGTAPKFPPASLIVFLLGRAVDGEQDAAEMALGTLRAMAAGGIHDQLGGGFARYSVDATWTVPHFEKMLYDNALLARAYLDGWLLSGEQALAETCRDTLDWALRELRGPEGGFCSALDADSEGVEGRFYVWTAEQLRAELDASDAEAAIAHLGVSERGSFEGANVLRADGGPRPERWERIRAALLAARERRVRPGLDDKRLTSWNALMLAALARAGAALPEPRYLDAARACAEFLLGELRDADGRLLRSWKDGRARLGAYLEDHAFLLEALLDLYEATFEARWFTAARALADTMVERFADDERGGFFTTPSDHERLIARRKDLEDTPIPSGSSSAALGLLRLAALTGEHGYERRALGVLRLTGRFAPRHPQAFGHLLQALDWHLGRVRELALAGPREEVEQLARVARGKLRPRLVMAGAAQTPGVDASHPGAAAVPLLAGREPLDGRAAAYVCEGFACRAPVTSAAELEGALSLPKGA